MGQLTINGPFSIAMLVYQRVSINSKTPSQFCQWKFQEPKIEVLYHINLALAQAFYMVGTSNLGT